MSPTVQLKAHRARLKSCVAALAASLVLCVAGAAMSQAPAEAPNRARLLGLQREAVSLLKLAARQDAPIDDVRRALLEAGQRLEALGAEPDPRAASDAAGAARLAPALRAELRRAARDLLAASRPDSDARRHGPVPGAARTGARRSSREKSPWA